MPAVLGALSSAAVVSHVEPMIPKIDACIAKKGPSPNGKVVVKWVVQTDGRVSRASVVGEQPELQHAGACFAKVIQAIRFPAPDSGIAIVRYPLQFSADGPTGSPVEEVRR